MNTERFKFILISSILVVNTAPTPTHTGIMASRAGFGFECRLL